ncbi:MAG: lectin-like domain-containing protein, partial [Planctomycetota bacterium]
GGGGAAMGGAIFLNYGSVNITNSTFTANSAKGGVNGGNGAQDGYGMGGAVFNLNGTLNINSSTFSGNSAYDGRQIYVLADQGFGMIGGDVNQSGQASVTLNNSIFGGADTNSTDVYVKAINGGTTTSAGASNLIRWNVGFTGGITSSADPLLLPLTNNGGPTNTMQPTNSLAPISGGTLYLTNKQNWLNNAVWYQVDPAENYATEGFTVSFVYQDVGGGGADGVAFVLQNDPRGFSALGSNGGGLGYQGIANSMAYAINVYAPGTVGSGLFTGGKIGTYQSTGNVNFASGNQIQVTLRYSTAVANQAGTFYETLRDLKTGATFSRTYTNFNLYSALGNNFNAVLGFTGGTRPTPLKP